MNGRIIQPYKARDMIFGVGETSAFVTGDMLLNDGDVLLMGTPSDVGYVRTSTLWLRHGFVAEVEIGRIEVLRSSIEDQRPKSPVATKHIAGKTALSATEGDTLRFSVQWR